ncbi:MAG: hypothetical protein C0623_12110 [Desulfuromonas sp.]|nr:MAG: hypothetical protein C0623_12110 [Desulfuromonas sp.]
MRIILCLFFMVFFTGSFSYSEGEQFKDWMVDFSDAGFIYAATISDTGNVFGQYCFIETEHCVYLIGMKTACKKDSEYPVLINSDKGAYNTSFICGGYLSKIDKYQYYFSDFDLIDKAAKKGNLIGFALPLQSDRFKVVRFSLRGSADSINFMRDAVSQLFKSRKQDKSKRPPRPSEETL